MALSWEKHPILTPPTDEEMARMEPDELVALWKTYHEAIANARKDPYRYGWVLPHWKQADKMLEKHRTMLLLGANRCLAGEQEIYDPIERRKKRVDQIDRPFHVYAWDDVAKCFVIAAAEVPFRKPQQELFRVELSNGEALLCSGEHVVLTPTGWNRVGSLKAGSRICGTPGKQTEERPPLSGKAPVASTWGIVQPACELSEPHSTQTPPDSQSDCPACSHLRDEQPRLAKDCAQGAFPSLSDVPGHRLLFGNTYRSPRGVVYRLLSGTRGGRDSKPEYTRFGQRFDPHAIPDGPRQNEDHGADILFHSYDKPSESVFEKFSNLLSLLGRRLSCLVSRQPQCGGVFRLSDSQSCCESPYGGNSVADVSVVNIYSLRNDVVWDFTVPVFHNYVASGVINHNSAKTSYGAKTCVRSALENEGALIYAFSQNQETSVLVQQAAVYHYLPEELKRKATESTHYMSYSMQNGFASNSIVFPNGSRILFKTYTQFQQNQTILEGMELGAIDPKWINVGAWLDEYLLGMEMIDRLYLRLATRNAKLLLTFTPKDGVTETVRYFTDGAKMVESRPAPLMEELHKWSKGRTVPYVQENEQKGVGIIYFHSADNPWGGFEAIKAQCRSKNDEKYTLTAAYGVPTKSYSSRFPTFSVDLNVVSHDKVPTKDVTRYMVLDPAGRKNWFMCWVAIDPTDTWWIYREWPDVSVGDWAEYRAGKWCEGAGAKGLGYGIRDYVDLITNLEAEHKEDIYERLIDPRLGAAKYQTQMGASSIIEELADAGLVFIPAPGLDIEDGLQALQTKMAYNQKAPIDGINRPHFYISSRCNNIITAMQEYTAEGGLEEAHKDPIDVLRYLAIDGARYIDPKAFKAKQSTRKGY